MSGIHSVTDKALFDALCQSRVTHNELRDLFLSRGILVSRTTDKKALAKNFSKLTHDFYVHQRISAIYGGFLRRERNTSVVISGNVNQEVLLAAANKLEEELLTEDDLCSVVSDKSSIRMHITYLSTNYGKSDFNQVEKKNATFEIEMLDGSFSLRRPDNEQAQNYEARLLAIVETMMRDNSDDESEGLNLNEISLQHIDDHEKRTLFFKKLINGLDGYELDDVTDVYVYHPKPTVIEEEKGDSDTGVHISRASLKGEGVLKSDELTSLYEKGFYIWKIRWRVKDKTPYSDLYEFEAQFSDPADCNDFSYISRGFKKFKSAGEYNKSTIQLSSSEEVKFYKLIEKTARFIILEFNAECDEVEDECSSES